MKIFLVSSVFLVLAFSISADQIRSDRDLYIGLHHFFEERSKEFIIDSLKYLGEREVVDESIKISLVSFYSKCLLDREIGTIIDEELKSPSSKLLQDIIHEAKVFDIDKILALSDPTATLNDQCLAAYSATGDPKYLEYLLNVYLNHAGDVQNNKLFISSFRAGELLNLEAQILDSVRAYLIGQKETTNSHLIDELLSVSRSTFLLKYFAIFGQNEDEIRKAPPNN